MLGTKFIILIHQHCEAFYRLQIPRLQIDKNSKAWVQRGNLQSSFFHLIRPAPSSHQKGTVIIVRLSLVARSRSEVKALGRGHEWLQFFNLTNPIKFLAFDTNNLLQFSCKKRKFTFRYFLCNCSTWFPSIFGTNNRLKKSNSKEPERSHCCRGGKWRNQQNVEMACSANQEEVFLPLDQSGVSNFALGERKIKKKCPLFRPINIQ